MPSPLYALLSEAKVKVKGHKSEGGTPIRDLPILDQWYVLYPEGDTPWFYKRLSHRM